MTLPYAPRTPAAAAPHGVLQWARAHPYLIVLAIVLVVFSVRHFRKHDGWTHVYVVTSKEFLASHEIYLTGTEFAYPPMNAVLTLPFVPMNEKVAQVTMYLISAAMLVWLIHWAWVLSDGSGQRKFGIRTRDDHLVMFWACLCAVRFSFNALDHLSLDLVIGALIMAGGLLMSRGRNDAAGLCWGFAASFKGPPLLLLCYMVWRRQWRGALLGCAVMVGVNLLPDLIRPSPDGRLWATHWVDTYIKPLTQSSYKPGWWHADLLDNQSVSGAANRWLMTDVYVDPGGPDGIKLLPAQDAVSPTTFKRLVYGVELLLCATIALVMRPGRLPSGQRLIGAQSSSAPKSQPPLVNRYALEVSVVILLILLLSPMTSRSLYCTMLLPAYCVARLAFVGRSFIAQAALVLACAGTLICYNLPFAKAFSATMLYLGMPTLGGLALLVPILIAIRADRLGQPPTA